MIRVASDTNLRLAARRRGFFLQKRRGSYCPELGDGYMIRDAYSGAPVAGHRYELEAEDVREFLNEK